MDGLGDIRTILLTKMSDDGDGVAIRDALGLIDALSQGSGSPEDLATQLISTLDRDLGWSDEEREQLKKVASELAQNHQSMRGGSGSAERDDSDNIPNISLVAPPSLQHASLSWQNTPLPDELASELSETYFLHILATNPEQVLPPGKSLLSALSQPEPEEAHSSELPSLQKKVEEIVHKAFWDEALEALSDPSPARQIDRLKGLYKDLQEILASVLPPKHTVLVTLSSPLSPTNAPLVSALRHLRSALAALRERCAPVRDADVDQAIVNVDEALSGSLQLRPAALIDATKSIHHITEVMKSDMKEFVLGRLTEAELRAEMRKQAMEREREFIMRIWKKELIQQSWRDWLQSETGGQNNRELSDSLWITRLLKALSLNVQVTCEFSPDGIDNSRPHGNPIPSPFLFSLPALVHIQNSIQALVITACLRILVRGTPSGTQASGSQSEATPAMSFTERVWVLLKAEVDAAPDSGDSDVKLINLADEVVRANGSTDETTNSKLRASVDRIIKFDDPVFALLQKRLISAFTSKVTSVHHERLSAVPVAMQTGQGRKRMRLEPGRADVVPVKKVEEFVVAGFEDPVLVREVRNVAQKLVDIVEWVNAVWKDTLDDL